jgi:hypothetical protein
VATVTSLWRSAAEKISSGAWQKTIFQSETGFLNSRSCVVKTTFGHIPSFEQSKRDVFIIVNLKNIFKIFYVPSEK